MASDVCADQWLSLHCGEGTGARGEVHPGMMGRQLLGSVSALELNVADWWGQEMR